jgi:hypothetical protein
VASATAVRSASAAVESTTTVELSATPEVTTATEAVAAVEVSAAIAAIKSASVSAATVVAIAAAAIIPTAAVVTISATIEAVPIAVKPGAGADEDAAYEPVRSVEAVGCAGVRIIIVVAIGADGRGAVIDRSAKSDAEGDALGLRVRSGEETNSETNAE